MRGTTACLPHGQRSGVAVGRRYTEGDAIRREEWWLTMRVITGLLAGIGFLVLLLFLAAIGLFAYDELRRRVSADDDDGESDAAAEAPGA